MRSVRSENTRPELIVRSILHRLGYRFRLHRKDLPGKPDIVFSAHHKVIFINGCFWHGHDCRRGSRVPKRNRDYWIAKIARNKQRDILHFSALKTRGWQALAVWECQCANSSELSQILDGFLGQRLQSEIKRSAMTGYYSRLREKRGDSQALQECINKVVGKLETADDADRPGLLLGKIQAGKTNAFLGVIAQAFDNGYDIAVVFTKGTKTLAQQTVKRIGRDFADFIDLDEALVFDIKTAPDRLTRAELNRKLVIVSKKEVRNLDRIHAFFSDDKHPKARKRRVLIVDDEADMASVRFTKKKGDEDYDQGEIAKRMDSLRDLLDDVSFLQVTATPYALYLQPDGYENGSGKEVFRPKKPAFTELLPIHSAYIGGDDYFGGHPVTDPRYYLFVKVTEEEQEALRNGDGRMVRKDRLWTSNNIKALRRSLVTFILAVYVRRRQQAAASQKLEKYAMVMHNDTHRAAHGWQEFVTTNLREAFEEAAADDDTRLREATKEAYDDLKKSVDADGGQMPSFDDAYEGLKTLLTDGELNIQCVNSDVQLEPILDPETAELKLRTQANLFIGGSILDRGITIKNLIAFYYGRNPKRMQADTVLQHSRMYGARARCDLAVTRFYTTQTVYDRLSQINSLEVALRQDFESGSFDNGVVFIQKDANGVIVPCAPSKISLSDTVSVRSNEMLLPTGFDTDAATRLNRAVPQIDQLIPNDCKDTFKFKEIPVQLAVAIIEAIRSTLVFTDEAEFDWDAMIAILRYHAGEANNEVAVIAATGRDLDREASGDKSGQSIVGTKLRSLIVDPNRKQPALILLKQVGGLEHHYKAGPFWWPVIATPATSRPCVFASKVAI